jgi:hypothetical protein
MRQGQIRLRLILGEFLENALELERVLLRPLVRHRAVVLDPRQNFS